jgi:hypothetical protein
MKYHDLELENTIVFDHTNSKLGPFLCGVNQPSWHTLRKIHESPPPAKTGAFQTIPADACPGAFAHVDESRYQDSSHDDPIKIKLKVDPQAEFDPEVVIITAVVVNVDILRCQTKENICVDRNIVAKKPLDPKTWNKCQGVLILSGIPI